MAEPPAPPAQRRPTAQHRVSVALRTAILDGSLPPGRRVSQEEWAARVGVSQIPVREALRALAGEGLVTYRPRRGYVVTELDLAELEEVYALRRTLETEALRRGVPLALASDVRALRADAEACRRAERGGDAIALLAANRAFHDRLHRLAGSRQLKRLIDLLWDSSEAYRALYYRLPGEVEEVDRAHEAIVAAVAAHDAVRVVELENAHRERALEQLRKVLATPSSEG
jgi:DNA-binding GntR family transcriptional regulator